MDSGSRSSTALLSFVRLARLLPVESFWHLRHTQAIIGVSVVLVGFGMAGAFLHRTAVTQDEDFAAAIYFTLQLIFLWTGAMIFIAGYWLHDASRLALWVLTITTAGTQLTKMPQVILTRRVVHRRLSVVQVAQAGATTLITIGLAHAGYMGAVSNGCRGDAAVLFGAMYVWRPVWRPHLHWQPAAVRYFGLWQQKCANHSNAIVGAG